MWKSRGCWRIIIEFTGFVASILQISNFLSGYSPTLKEVSPDNIFRGADPILNLLIIVYGLIGLGVFIWRFVDVRATKVSSGIRMFVVAHSLATAFLLILYLRAFSIPIFSFISLIYFLTVEIVCGVISYNLHIMFSSKPYHSKHFL